MRALSFIRSFLPTNRRTAADTARRSRTAFRPALTLLEDRTLLSLYHVALTGGDGNDGSALNPFRTIQRAITEAASASDGADEIRVAQGTYAQSGVDLGLSVPSSANIESLAILGGWDSTFTTRTPRSTVYIPQTAGSNVVSDVDVFDAGVTIDGFHFVFDSLQGTGGTRLSAGVFSRAAGLTLSDNTIEIGKSIGGQRSAGYQSVTGTDRSNITIAGNTFLADAGDPSAFSDPSHGIFLNPGTASSVLISDNIFSGSNCVSVS